MRYWYLFSLVILWSQIEPTIAATISWFGASNSNFTAAGNWVGGIAPGDTDSASFGSVSNQTVNINGQRTLSSALFNAPDTYTITGNQLNLTGGLTQNGSGTVTFTNNVRYTADQTWAINSGTVEMQGVISNPYYMTLTKSGTGLLILSGNNTMQGPLVITGGTVRVTNSNGLGASNHGNVVASGASLELAGGINVNEGGITISGNGASGTGALRNLSGNNTLSAQVSLGANTLIQSDGGTLTLTNQFAANSYNLTLAGNGNIVITPNIWDGGDLTILGAGNHTFGASVGLGGNDLVINATGNQTFSGQISSGTFTMSSSGTTTLVGGGTINVTNGLNVSGGTLILNKSTTDAVQSNITIENATVRLEADQQIQQSNNVAVWVKEGGLFDLNNHNESIDMIKMTGGTVTTGTGTLNISNTGGTNVVTYASSNSSTITGHLSFSGPNPIVQVANGSAAIDLNVNATIDATNGFTKTGEGVMKVNQTVTSGGPVEINQGTLLLGASNIIANTVQIKLSGGTLATGGYSDTVGKLTLSASSTIDMGSGNSILTFDSATYSGGTLTVTNWNGSASGGGTDQILFNTAPSATFLANVYWAGLGTTGAMMIGNEMVPIVPEPGTVAGGLLLVGFALWRLRRRLRGR